MPLTAFQRELLLLLAKNRNPESYVAGGTAINRTPDSPRFSRDVDFFNDPAISVLETSAFDIKVLEKTGYEVEVSLRQPGFVRCSVSRAQGARHPAIPVGVVRHP